MGNYISDSVHVFQSIEDMKFAPEDYSHLKFGSDRIAKKFGYELAEDFFKKHAARLMSENCVVIPGPYNFVPNAATIMTKHFVDKLNYLLVNANGSHVEYSTIHRKVTYTNDFGFLPEEQRRRLIGNDSFYLNRGFLEGKTLILVDDIKITGTHEDKMIDIFEKKSLPNPAFFLYYARYAYKGTGAEIEGKINFSGIKTLEDYIRLSQEPNHHLIVRPIKYLLSQKVEDFRRAISAFPNEWVEKFYHACLGEGYYKIPAYQKNLQEITNRLNLIFS